MHCVISAGARLAMVASSRRIWLPLGCRKTFRFCYAFGRRCCRSRPSADPGLLASPVPELLQFIETSPAAWAYAFVALAALLEYVFPPLPGDTVVLFAVFLAARAQLSAAPVLVAATVGATAGGVVAWAVGVWLLRHHDGWPASLKTARVEAGLSAVQRGYDRYGPFYLLVNRFLPAFRAFFFIGAGLSAVSLQSVVMFGALSALLWNGLLIGAGYSAAYNWPLLQQWLGQYSAAAFIVLGVFAIGWLLKRSR